MALSADTDRKYEAGVEPVFGDLPVAASTTVYAGSCCTYKTDGYVRPFEGTGSDTFAGFADAKIDNSSGSDGDEDVHLRQKGIVILDVTGVTGVGNVGDAVYASDDDTFTTTSSSAHEQIGKIVRWITGTTCAVYFEAAQLRSI